MTRTITSDDRPESMSTIISRLSTAQKSNRGAPGYSRWVNRPLGRLLAATAYRAGLTPNQVTALSATLSFAAIALAAAVRPTAWVGLLLALMLIVAYALDSADGQLARLQGSGSARGEWLDHVVDCAKTCSLHLAVAVCWYRYFALPDHAWLLVPMIFCLQATVAFFTFILTDQLRGRAATVDEAQSGVAPASRSIIKLPTDYGVLCLSFALLGAQESFRWIYTALLILNIIFLAATMRRSWGLLK